MDLFCYNINIYINAVIMNIIPIVFIMHIMSCFSVVLYSFGVSVSVVVSCVSCVVMYFLLLNIVMSLFGLMFSSDSKYEQI